MTAITFRFHGDAHEMFAIVAEWARDAGLRVAAERFFPAYEVTALASHDISEAMAELGQVNRLAVQRDQFDLTATRPLWFVQRNPDSLFLTVAWPRDDALRESALDGATDDEDLLRTWRLMLRRFKGSMHKGASLRGWTGIPGTAPAHKHTVGAHRLAEQGIRMLAGAGGTEYLFDDVPPARSDRDPDPMMLLREAEAGYRLAPEDWMRPALVAIAADLVRRGIDSANLRTLAGADRVDIAEVIQRLDATLADLGLEPLDERRSLETALQSIARLLIEGALDPDSAAHQLWDLWYQRGTELDLGPEAQRLAYAADSFGRLEDDAQDAAAAVLVAAAQRYLGRDRSTSPGDSPER